MRNQPFILPTQDSKLRHDLDHYFRIHNINVDVAIECQDTSVQKTLGIDGMGLAPLPDFAGEEFVQEKKLISSFFDRANAMNVYVRIGAGF